MVDVCSQCWEGRGKRVLGALWLASQPQEVSEPQVNERLKQSKVFLLTNDKLSSGLYTRLHRQKASLSPPHPLSHRV